MPTSLLLHLIAVAQNILWGSAIVCVVTTSAAYHPSKNVAIHPHTPFLSALCALAGTLSVALSPALFCATIIVYAGTLFLYAGPFRTPLIHGGCCLLIAAFSYGVAAKKLSLGAALLADQPQMLDGVVTSMRRWPRTSHGWVVDLRLMAAKGTAGLYGFDLHIPCFTHCKPRCKSGDVVRLYEVSVSTKGARSLSEQARMVRDHQVGVVFSPFLRTRTRATPHPAYWLTAALEQKKHALLNSLEKKLSSQAYTYFNALFLGNRATPTYPAVRRLFNRWGITHYLARSGLHIALLIFLWSLLLLCLPAPLWLKQGVLIVLIGCYSMLSWPSVSFERALWLWLFYTLALLCYRSAQPLYLLSLLTLAVVLVWPANALCLDFQLSFFLTAILMLTGRGNKQHFISDGLHSKT